MTQTIQQRRALADRVHRAPVSISRRREQRANVIQWRDQAKPSAPMVDSKSASDPLLNGKVENVILAIFAIAALAIAHKTGVLAAIVDMVGAL